MRAAGLAVLLPLLVACSSTPPAPSAEAAWSAWSPPERGLSFRAQVPARALRGALIPVVLAFRAHPALVPEGRNHLDGANLGEWTRLVFRQGDTGATVEIRLDEEEHVLETPAEGEDQALREHPEWMSLVEDGTREWQVKFPLSIAWEALVPGSWEVRTVLEKEPRAGDPGAWSGSIATPPVLLVIEDPPLRRIEVHVPRAIHLRARSKFSGGLEAFMGPEDSEVVTVEARTGFLMGMAWRQGGAVRVEGYGEDVDGTSFSGTVDTAPDGSMDETHEVEIFECGREPYELHDHRPGHAAYRTLWKRSYRVAFTAAEIEALRR